jgi:sialic acid synthase SpsE/quercetin dioxygenase-like cupin family protein
MNEKLVILEMANNHMGDLEHGINTIKAFASLARDFKEDFRFAFKFQFRDLDTFIRPDYRDKLDHKYVKRFLETQLSREQFETLKKAAEHSGFRTMCTAFDEPSVDLIKDMGFSFIKVASCSFNDWPLLNKVVELNSRIVISAAGANVDEVDNVVSFLKNRDKKFFLMHCVGEYPTRLESLELNQIDYLKKRYKDVPIGFSTHEDPDNYSAVMLAIAKGAELFEKHVALETDEYPRNAYSVNAEEMREWLRAASSALKMCGDGGSRYFPSDKELSDLRQFKRGVFAKTRIEEGETIDRSNVYYAWPAQEDQVLANDMSKYTHYVATHTFEPNDPIIHTHHKWKDDANQVKKVETRESILKIVQDVKWFLQRSAVVFPGKAKLEISHHYGVDKFYDTGISMITVVNREYCKKLIIVLPNQNHPEQYHKKKEETFVVLHGSVNLYLDDTLHVLEKGDVITVEPKVRHSFTSKEGCVIEEVSSTHYIDDSYYTDENITENENRKTIINYWID